MKILKTIISEFFISIIIVLSLIFAVSSKSYATPQYAYHPFENFNERFEVDSLEKATIDSILLKKAVDEISLGKYGEVHSMLIFKDNKIVFEEYFKGNRYKYDGANHHG
jgi:hypothetical protein